MSPAEPKPRRPALNGLTLALGVVLLAGALIVVWRQRAVVADALSAVASPQPLPLIVLLAGVLINVVLAGAMFSVLMAPYGRVGRAEMQALIAATTLVNYVPLRPGLFGRIAYHRQVNAIPIAHSARTIVEAAVMTVGVAVYLAVVVTLAVQLGLSLWYGAVAPLPVLLTVAALSTTGRRLSLAGLIRYAEVLVWAVRYYAAFALLDLPIGADSALAFACISVIATMVPLVSNGLGLREWAIGLVAPLLTAYQLSLGITAELVNRAAEMIIIGITGTLGLIYLSRLRRAAP